MDIVPIILSILGLILGFGVGYYVAGKAAQTKIVDAEAQAKVIRSEAQGEAKALLKEKALEAKEEWHKRKQDFENKTQSSRDKLLNLEKQIKNREENIDKKLEIVTRKEKQLQTLDREVGQKSQKIEKKLAEVEALVEEQNTRLERITGMSREDALKYLMENLENEAKAAAAHLIKEIRDDAKLKAKREAQKVVVQAIQRTASDHAIETTVSVVNLASEDMKGRIIGREGRNIRAFEAATGVDLIIDDTPEAVIISGFDPFRRQVAKIALERLMSDGRIHPSRIEELVNKTEKELEEEIRQEGENALLELNIHNVHPELVRLVGKMKYRSSYGQNLLHHSIEVAYLCGIMAVELGFDPRLAKRAGLLHDVGKCVDRNIEGPHALLGYELAKRYKEHPIVANAIGAHHEDIEMESPIAAIVQACDGISGARPGARRESLENYIKRLEKLESIAGSFEGVNKTYAIQAGREIRVIVEPERVDDLLADQLANDIAARVENELEYPGQIRVTIVREYRSTSFAK